MRRSLRPRTEIALGFLLVGLAWEEGEGGGTRRSFVLWIRALGCLIVHSLGLSIRYLVPSGSSVWAGWLAAHLDVGTSHRTSAGTLMFLSRVSTSSRAGTGACACPSVWVREPLKKQYRWEMGSLLSPDILAGG